MKITTNYSKKDWNRAIPRVVICSIPLIFLFWAVFYLYMPYFEDWSTYLAFSVNEKTFTELIQNVKENNTSGNLLNSPDGFVMFMFLMWFGSAIFPLLVLVMFQRIIPVDYIIKKLGLESRMKLVVFKDGKPIHKVRDLFK